MYKILAYLAKYILGKELVIGNGTKMRSVLTGRYRKVPKPIVYVGDMREFNGLSRYE